MFNNIKKWFKTDEISDELLLSQRENDDLRERLIEAQSLADMKLTLRCEAKNCLDWHDSMCMLDKVTIGFSGECQDYCSAQEADEELKQAAKNSLF